MSPSFLPFLVKVIKGYFGPAHLRTPFIEHLEIASLPLHPSFFGKIPLRTGMRKRLFKKHIKVSSPGFHVRPALRLSAAALPPFILKIIAEEPSSPKWDSFGVNYELKETLKSFPRKIQHCLYLKFSVFAVRGE